jgi:uncharacterized protein YegL
MPRLNASAMENHQLAGNFSFTGARIANLGATEYTLVSVFVDVSGSVGGFADQLREMLITAVQACQKSPRSDNLMVRVVLFSTMFSREGTSEVHGFKPLAEIDPQAYPPLRTGGGTPLYDATYNGIAAMNTYAQELVNNDYQVNGITFIITDGEESPRASTATPKMIAAEMRKSVTGEVLESHVSVLIGMNATDCRVALDAFKQEAEISEYRDAGSITPADLAKLAKFVSQSVSSQSQALGTGGPSQTISATI